MPRKDAGSGPSATAQAQQDAASDGIDAYELPKSLVTKLARSAVCTHNLLSMCFPSAFSADLLNRSLRMRSCRRRLCSRS